MINEDDAKVFGSNAMQKDISTKRDDMTNPKL